MRTTIFTLLVAVLVGSVQMNAQKTKLKKRPNIIFILSDDHAYLASGFNGNKEIKTPNLDRLADSGIVFDNYYNTTAICMASRAEIMTGMLEYKTGCNFAHGSLTRDQFQKSYPVLLRKAGYEVSFAGKFGFPVRPEKSNNSKYYSNEEMPIQEFDVWRGGYGQTSYTTVENSTIKEYADRYPHSSRAYGAWASDYIRAKKDEDGPFCMSISFKAPHNPQNPDPFFDDVYKGVRFSKAENYGRENAQHLAEQARNGRQYLRLFRQYKFDEKNYQESVRKYYQLIYGVDYAVGMILKALEESGLDKNTIIIYTSDNGYHMGAHGLGGKVLPYEEGTKAPFIYFDPRHKNMSKQLRSNALVGNIDIAPTLLALADVAIPENMDGKDIAPLISKPKKHIRKFLPVMNLWGSAPTHMLSIQMEDKKYMYWPYEGHGMKSVEEVFDKVNDPFEMKNVLQETSKKELKVFRKYYDQVMSDWNKEGLDYNNYSFYKIYFDRSKNWEEKEKVLPKTFLSSYKRELERANQ